jgi:hypothetical protein
LSRRRKRYQSENRNQRRHSHFPDLVTPVDEPGVVYEDVDLLEVLREEVEELCFRGILRGRYGRFDRDWSGGGLGGSIVGLGRKDVIEKTREGEDRSQISLCQPANCVEG